MERNQNSNENRIEENFIKHFQEKGFREEIGKLVYRIWYETNTLYWTWNTYEFLFNPLRGHIELLDNAARTFFLLLDQIFPQDIEMGISRLMDPAKFRRKENASLENLIDKLESDRNGNLHKEWKVLKKQYVKSGIQSNRNTVYAHSDLSSNNYNKIKRTDLEQILEKIENLVNNVIRPRSENVQETSFKDLFDPLGASSLVSTIKEALKCEKIRNTMFKKMEDTPFYKEIYKIIFRD